MHNTKELRHLIEFAKSLGYGTRPTRDGVQFVHSVRAVRIVAAHGSPSDHRASANLRSELRRGLRNIKCARPECTEIVPDLALIYGDGHCSRKCLELAKGIRSATSDDQIEQDARNILQEVVAK